MPTRNMRGAYAPMVIALLALVFVGGAVEQAVAQTPYVPYFGKNRIRYNDFKWRIYTTDHFEIYHYPDFESELERIASYAESAYQQVSSDLKHDLAFKVPLVLFKTQSEFQQQNIEPGELPEGVLAFAEPYRDRMVLPIDEPSDALYRLITHELTHIFEFDIIPRSLLHRGLPLWVDEGLADHLTGYWQPFDLMSVRDAAIADIIPPMSDFQGQAFVDGRLPYNLGHAAFEFIEARWGKEGLRQFLFALRKAVIGGGESAYEEAFRLKPEEFDEQFEKYLKDRFKPFRDKERPADYGRDLAPKRGKTPYTVVVSIEPSPSGDLMAVAAGNRKEQELDIVLMSTKDGKIIRNLTGGFNKDKGFEYIATPGGFRNNAVSWMSWAPAGDRLAYFARTEKYKTLILQNVVTRDIEKRIELKTVDMPESPDISPDGREVAFSGLAGAIGDIFIVNIETGQVRNVTNDRFGDYAPTFSPDGKSLVYLARISMNDKLFKLDLATGVKTQITFGTHDDGGAQFVDADTIVFPSTAVVPDPPLDPEVARNGNIYNIWTLSLKTGELKQFTDALTGNVSPIVLRDQKQTEDRVRHLLQGGIRHPHAAAPGAPAHRGELRFRRARAGHRLRAAPEPHAGEGEHQEQGHVREAVPGGASAGRHRRHERRRSVRRHAGHVHRRARRQAVQHLRLVGRAVPDDVVLVHEPVEADPVRPAGVLADAVLLRLQPRRALRPGSGLSRSRRCDRDADLARGDRVRHLPVQPLRAGRVLGGHLQLQSGLQRPGPAGCWPTSTSSNSTAAQLFSSGTFMPFGVSYVQETTVFREYGPLAGNTVRLGYEYAPSWGGLDSRQTVDADARYYLRLATNGVLAFRARGFKSWGEFPGYMYFGGNSELRGYEYLEFLGNKSFFLNGELRFPLIEAALTPLGVIGGLRGVAFAGLGATGYQGIPMQVYTNDPIIVTPLIGFEPNFATMTYDPIFGPPKAIGGLKLVDGRASYGVGLETFALGFPIHFDWSWRTLLNKEYEDYVFAYQAIQDGEVSGSKWLRKPKFSVWIGYDF